MFEILIFSVTIGAIAIAIRVYYKSLDEKSKTKRDFSNDGQLHLIYPES